MDGICQFCGRFMSERKSWRGGEVNFCSQRCRGYQKKFGSDFEDEILKLLEHLPKSKTACPMQILIGERQENPELKERVRCAVRRLAHKNLIYILQKGKKVRPESIVGPIEIRKI